MTKVTIISDTHGYHQRLNIVGGDILIHCGDFCNFSHFRKMRGLIDFDQWVSALPFQYCLFITGNWDPKLTLEAAEKYCPHMIFIGNKTVELCGLKIHGALKNGYMAIIPDNLDILVTHYPPHRIGDKAFIGNHAGNKRLRHVLENMDSPPHYHFFGHIHEARGTYKVDGISTNFVNASNYKKHSPILLTDL